jgi:ATP-binding cassette subfamily F protein 3
MDEPTNHLDLESSEALAAALETFGGTLLFVSHNRSFVRHLATRIWNVENGAVEEYPGTFDEYMDRCRRLERERERAVADAGDTDADVGASGRAADTGASQSPASAKRAGTAGGKPVAGDAGSVSKTKAHAHMPGTTDGDAKRAEGAGEAKASTAGQKAARAPQKNKRALERKIAEIEERIAALEAVQAERSAELSKPETYADRARYGELLSAYQDDAAKLEELIARWERTQADLTAGA